jgi:hypothetical protein
MPMPMAPMTSMVLLMKVAEVMFARAVVLAFMAVVVIVVDVMVVLLKPRLCPDCHRFQIHRRCLRICFRRQL